MPSLNPKVVRHLFTELALHLDIDEDEHPSDIIQATLREIESLKRDHASLQKAYKALQNGTLSDLLEAMLNRNEELEHENETLQKLQKRYTFLKEVYKALQGEHVFLRMERKEYGALQMYQEELVGLYDSYIKGIEDSAREFMGALARVLGVGEAGLSREVIFESISKLIDESKRNAKAAATASQEAEEAKQTVQKLEKTVKRYKRKLAMYQ